MRSRLLGVVAMTALMLVGAGATAAAAGAGTSMAPSGDPGTCTITVSGDVGPDGTTIKAFPVDVVVSGTVPGAATQLRLFVRTEGDPAFVQRGETVPVDGKYAFPAITLAGPSEFSVGFLYGDLNAYTATCSDPSGSNVIRIRVADATAARSLAFTGSSDTMRNVLIGLAAIALGLVLVVGARRRHHVDV